MARIFLKWLESGQIIINCKKVLKESTVKVFNAYQAIQLIQLSEKQNEQFEPIIVTTKTKVNE